ncbi:MAG TPA: ClpXP protease specificity-enhancing factor SspB [Methylocella sp.]|jgi:hypothetical protein
MPVDLLRYDLLVQDALRGVIRQVLYGAARNGLPGDHHFYISFRTHAKGVRLSSRMRELYPDEMTIILQHQFWDLTVGDDAFEVGLSFRNVPEMLLIPFEAVTRFFDPSVGFEAKFAVEDEAANIESGNPGPARLHAVPASGEVSTPPLLEADPARQPASPSPSVEEASVDEAGPHPDDSAQNGTKVVSIDAFRKKN